MLDIKLIRDNPEFVKQNAANQHANVDVDAILELDERRRGVITEVEKLKAKRNEKSRSIAEFKKSKKDTSEIIADMKLVSEKIKNLDDNLKQLDIDLNKSLSTIPNMTQDDIPIGKSDSDNELVRSWGDPQGSISNKNHIEIAKQLGIIDFERGAKVTGGGFAFLVGKGARLERALINFFLDQHIENGYTEIFPPFIVNEDSMYGTGQLPKMAEDMYHARDDNYYLIPTAEVPLTNFFRGDVLTGMEVPTKFCGYSPCFRREAGSYGKEVHGFLRVHQFNKVELVQFVHPEESNLMLDRLVTDAENILKLLDLPYRVVLLCTGDTSFASSKTFDLEVWAAGEKRWLEVSSCSNFTDFQARRANIRYKPTPDSKPIFVHTLNGSGLATPRVMVSLIENNFDGEKITIPEALREYTGFDFIN